MPKFTTSIFKGQADNTAVSGLCKEFWNIILFFDVVGNAAANALLGLPTDIHFKKFKGVHNDQVRSCLIP